MGFCRDARSAVLARAPLARHRGVGAGRLTRTIWLASYPKSGNTWMRALLGNILTEDGGPGGISALVYGNASDRTRFDFVMLIDSSMLTHDEIDCLRPRAYKAIAGGDYDDCFVTSKARKPVRFIKAHEA